MYLFVCFGDIYTNFLCIVHYYMSLYIYIDSMKIFCCARLLCLYMFIMKKITNLFEFMQFVIRNIVKKINNNFFLYIVIEMLRNAWQNPKVPWLLNDTFSSYLPILMLTVGESY